MEILLIGVILWFVMERQKVIDTNRFIKDNRQYFKRLKEEE